MAPGPEDDIVATFSEVVDEDDDGGGVAETVETAPVTEEEGSADGSS